MRNKRIVLAAVLLTLVGPPSAWSQAKNNSVRSQMLVSTQWLTDHIKDPNVVVLHVADNETDFKRGHIPGAHYLAFNKVTDDSGKVTTELPSAEQLRRAFSEAGVGDDSRVVIYATNWFPNAARVFYTLDYVGHGDKAALLDGGIEQWIAEDRPVKGGSEPVTPATFTPHVNDHVRALMDEVKKASEGDEQAQVVDARPARRYTAGHVPGAVNLYWMDTLQSEQHPVFRSPDELRKLYVDRGIEPGKKVLTYCEVGMQASHAYFLAKYLGYDAAMYDGSWQEWSASSQPMVKGEAKR